MTEINSQSHFMTPRFSRILAYSAAVLLATGSFTGFVSPALAFTENDAPIFTLEAPVTGDINEGVSPTAFSTVALQPVSEVALAEPTDKPAPLLGTAVSESNLNQGVRSTTPEPPVENNPTVKTSVPGLETTTQKSSSHEPTNSSYTAPNTDTRAPAPQESLKVPAAPGLVDSTSVEPGSASAAPVTPVAPATVPSQPAKVSAPVASHAPVGDTSQRPAESSLAQQSAITSDLAIPWALGIGISLLVAVGLMGWFLRKEPRISE